MVLIITVELVTGGVVLITTVELVTGGVVLITTVELVTGGVVLITTVELVTSGVVLITTVELVTGGVVLITTVSLVIGSVSPPGSNPVVSSKYHRILNSYPFNSGEPPMGNLLPKFIAQRAKKGSGVVAHDALSEDLVPLKGCVLWHRCAFMVRTVVTWRAAEAFG